MEHVYIICRVDFQLLFHYIFSVKIFTTKKDITLNLDVYQFRLPSSNNYHCDHYAAAPGQCVLSIVI